MLAALAIRELGNRAAKIPAFEIATAPGTARPEGGADLLEEAVVTKIIDGDTVVVEGGRTVRLLGIDADEKGYPCYQAAKDRLESLVLGKSVRLEASESDTDRYGRQLRYVFCEAGNTSVILAREGLVVARFFPDNKLYRAEVSEAENSAKIAARGCKWGHTGSTAGF